MTKPADAKAREQMESRAREYAAKTFYGPWKIADVATFAESERSSAIKEAREECARIAEDPANREPGWSLATQQMIAAKIRALGER